MGSTRFVTKRQVAAESFRVVRQGPAVTEYEARYTSGRAGVCRVRLSPSVPLALVTEEFDFGEVTPGEDLLLLDLNRGWQPQGIAWVPGSGEQQMPVLQSSAYADFVDGKRRAKPAEAPVGGVGQAPAPYRPAQGLVLLDKILPAGRWGDAKGGVQVWAG